MHNFPQFTRSTIWGEFASVGQLFSREVLWWGGNCSGSIFLRDNCPGAIVLGAIFHGDNYPRGKLSGEAIIQGALIQGAVSGGQFFSGGIVPEVESTLSADLLSKAQATHRFKFRCAHKVVKKEGLHMV